MTTAHWVGTGLSAVPGLRRLISTGQKTLVWNRTVSKAEQATAGLRGDFSIQAFSKEALAAKGRTLCIELLYQ
jgi:saccharopine dehydrogenase (NADP+, L-glutamate forming)